MKTGVPLLPNLGTLGESYRNLALRVEARLKAQGSSARSFCVTSAESGSGKSVTSFNLALALAEMTDAKILLVDADTTHPTLHQYLDLSESERSDGKRRNGSLEFRTLPVAEYGISVLLHDQIPKHGRTPSVSGLEALDQWARKNYDLVIFDSPPLFAASAFQLTQFVDGVLVVARAQVTRKRDFELLVQELGPDKVLGVVLNDSVGARPEHYGYY